MTVERIPVSISTDCSRTDGRHIGYSAGLEFRKMLPFPIVDIVVQTIEPRETRECHYHPSDRGKVEVFLPIMGDALLEWHESHNSHISGQETMKGIFDEPFMFRVNPGTCHRVTATTDFLWLSLNNVPYAKDLDAYDCTHGFYLGDRRTRDDSSP
jgi:hypothetical protein